MNERIQELMEQAGLHDFVIESMGIDEEMEKFAELIVKKCAECIMTPDVDVQKPYDQVFQILRETLVNEMQVYFGVKNEKNLVQ